MDLAQACAGIQVAAGCCLTPPAAPVGSAATSADSSHFILEILIGLKYDMGNFEVTAQLAFQQRKANFGCMYKRYMRLVGGRGSYLEDGRWRSWV